MSDRGTDSAGLPMRVYHYPRGSWAVPAAIVVTALWTGVVWFLWTYPWGAPPPERWQLVGVLLALSAVTLSALWAPCLTARRLGKNAWVRVDRDGITVSDIRGRERRVVWREARGVAVGPASPPPEFGARPVNADVTVFGPQDRAEVRGGIEHPESLIAAIGGYGAFVTHDAEGRPLDFWDQRLSTTDPASAPSPYVYRYPYRGFGVLPTVGFAVLFLGMAAFARLNRLGEVDALGMTAFTWVISVGLLIVTVVIVVADRAGRRRAANAWVRVDEEGIGISDARGRVGTVAWHDVEHVELRPRSALYAATASELTHWDMFIVSGHSNKRRIAPGVQHPEALAMAMMRHGHLSDIGPDGRPSRVWSRRTS